MDPPVSRSVRADTLNKPGFLQLSELPGDRGTMQTRSRGEFYLPDRAVFGQHG